MAEQMQAVSSQPGAADGRRWTHRSALIRLLLAIVLLQLLYWWLIYPAMVAPVGRIERLAVTAAEVATLDGIESEQVDDARFDAVELPWEDCCEPGYRLARMRFAVSELPGSELAIVPIVGSDNFRLWINDTLIYGEGQMTLPRISYHGNVRAVFRIPASALRQGDNEIRMLMVRDAGSPNFFVAAPVIGPYEQVQSAFKVRRFMLNDLNVISYSIGLVLVLMVAIVLARGERPWALIWLGVLIAAWTLRLLYYELSEPPLRAQARMALLFAMVNLMPVAWLNLANHWGLKPVPRVASVSLGAYLLLSIVNTVILTGSLLDKVETVETLSMGFSLVLALAAFGAFARQFPSVARQRVAETAVFTLCISLIAVDAFNALIGGYHGDHVSKAMPLLMLGLVAAFLSHNVQLFRSAAQINLLLTDRLREREAELKRNHELVREAERTQVLAAERRRLMQDMHDGVGGQLAALVSLAQQGRSNPEQLLQATAQGLADLRLIIDSLTQVDDDLAMALGALRARLQPVLNEAGVALKWRVDPRLSMPGFGPERVLQVYRIVQEAVNNALRHAQAKTVTLVFEPVGEGAELRIEDDGSGLPAPEERAQIRRGIGLSAMAERATRVGARFDIGSGEQGGTVVRLGWDVLTLNAD
ncbi:MAG: ATP-binding protein [Lysobacterales bacterium]